MEYRQQGSIGITQALPGAGKVTPVLEISCQLSSGETRTASFNESLCIGREASCRVRFMNDQVSRRHAELLCDGVHWHIRDLGSSNGTYLDGRRVEQEVLPQTSVLQLGLEGPILALRLVAAPALPAAAPVPETPSIAAATPAPIPQPADNTAPIAAAHSPRIASQVMTGAAPAALLIDFESGSGEKQSIRCLDRACIGRDKSCDIQVYGDSVSRRHAEVYHDGRHWRVKDLGSSNGIFLDGELVADAPVQAASRLMLGNDGPVLNMTIEAAQKTPGGKKKPQSSDAEESMAEIARRYFDASPDGEAGERTLMIRKAFQHVKKKQKRRYHGVIASIGALLVASVAFGIYQYIEVQKAREVAIQIFYTMKTLDMQVSKVEETVKERVKAADVQEEVERKRKQVAELEKQYDGFLEEFGIMTRTMSEEDRLIFKVARIYGECELVMPKGFAKEVKNYINKWKGTNRLKQAMAKVAANGYAETISRNMAAHNLPPQFLYLALQESNFDTAAVGPETRFGIAKGIWQFIPDTARDYGLTVGPLAGSPEYDGADERFNFELATQAASRFIRKMYNSDAQASALLVMASYNWGPGNILNLIRKMPENPRDRNFWKLLEQHQVPKETYDYVFYIFAATVIGENPRLFGFDFDNPLQADVKREQR